jgi:hypothetical protein
MEFTPPTNGRLSDETEAAFALTTIFRCPTLNEAQMVVSLLASFGIVAIIDSENYFRMFGGSMPGMARIQVQVRQLDAGAAMEILNEGAADPVAEELP